MTTPFFSIIIPTFNSEQTLKECLISILNQQFVDFEILLIDGLSKDETVSIAQGLNDKRIKIFSEKDEGIYDAMNKGISYAKGKWLYFLGGDDKIFDNTILQKVADKARYKKVNMIYGNVMMNDKMTLHCGEINDVEILYQNICHQAIFYKHNIFENHLYDLKFKVCADYDLNLKIFQHNYEQIFYTNIIIANYSNTGFSTFTTDDFKKNLEKIRKEFLNTKTWYFKIRYNLYNLQLQLKPSHLRGAIFKLFKLLSYRL